MGAVVDGRDKRPDEGAGDEQRIRDASREADGEGDASDQQPRRKAFHDKRPGAQPVEHGRVQVALDDGVECSVQRSGVFRMRCEEEQHEQAEQDAKYPCRARI